MYWRILLLLALGLCVGCLAGPVSSFSRDSGISVEIWANTRCPGIGHRVNLRATVANSSNRTKVIQLTDKPILDIEVSVEGGKTAHWSDNHPLTPDQRHMELKPGEFRSIEMEVVPSTLSLSGAPAYATALALYSYGDAPSQGLAPIINLGIGLCH